MDARLYVYAYLLLAAVYAGACVQYLNVITRTAQLARGLQAGTSDSSSLRLADESVRDATQIAVRSILGIDSAAFASAVLPVAYVAVTGLFGNLISRNAASASALNPLWLAVTTALVVGHMVFLTRLVALNSKLTDASEAILSPSFVSRHISMLFYYRVFMLVVTVFNIANTLYLFATLKTVTSLPFVGL